MRRPFPQFLILLVSVHFLGLGCSTGAEEDDGVPSSGGSDPGGSGGLHFESGGSGSLGSGGTPVALGGGFSDGGSPGIGGQVSGGGFNVGGADSGGSGPGGS
jgi:hypothetical protein